MTIKQTLGAILLTSALALSSVGCSKSEGEKAGVKPVASVPAYGTAVGIASGDMNGDGRLDALVASYKGSDTHIYLMKNKGYGRYSTTKIGAVPAYGTAVGIASGDMNGDGRLDALVASYKGSDTDIYVLLNNGDGTFSPQK